MYHFFGYDGYIAHYEVAIRLLNELEGHLKSYRPSARDANDLLDVLHATRELLARAQNHRLE